MAGHFFAKGAARWLGFWCCGSGDFFDADGVGPFGDEGVSFFHRHPGILQKHLRAFAAAPGEIAEEVLPADTMRAGWGIDFRLAAIDEAGQIVHSILRFNRMLKNSASIVLGSSKSSTYPQGYASGFDSPAALPGTRRVLARQGWAGEKAAFLSILRDLCLAAPDMQAIEVQRC